MTKPLNIPRVRIHVNESLQQGATVTLDGSKRNYIHNVLRLVVGNSIRVFNGRDGEWLAQITSVGKNRTDLTITTSIAPQVASPDVTLAFGLVKKEPVECIIRQGTELGISRFMPMITSNTVNRTCSMERLQTIAIEAAGQCERLDVPVITEPQDFSQILKSLKDIPSVFFCDESGGSQYDNLSTDTYGYIAIVIGSEGGFTAIELQQMRELQNFRAMNLGPRILKADTASAAAISVIMNRFGDWNLKPSFRIVS